jgi:hypothetical protein
VVDRFELFRLSLVPRDQRRLFDEEITKEGYLRRAFTRDWVFQHRGTEFHYKANKKFSTPEALLGRLGRQVTSEENRPPEEDFIEIVHDGWKACVLVVDPTDHADGQKASLQIDRQVGKPNSLMASLIKAINEEYTDAPYSLEAQPIFDSSTFWQFAEENKGLITSLTFEFVVPNGLWSARDNAREGLVRFRDKMSAQKVITTFKSEDGLNTDAEPVHDAVSYAEKGSGAIKARAIGKKTFNSQMTPKVVTLKEAEDEMKRESIISRVAQKISEVLGRE